MKLITKILIVLCLIMANNNIFAQYIESGVAEQTAIRFWNTNNEKSNKLTINALQYNNIPSAWLIQNSDKRFVIVSADSLLRPVLAYGDSITSMSSGEYLIWEKIMASDYLNRIQAVKGGFIPSEKSFWTEPERKLFQQWPPEGTTSTGGWLSTNWTQSAPYNKLCPMDITAGSRSIVGCPATAMAQIFNYHKTVNNTHFSDDDDYYHNFGNGNRYWIDNDYIERDFPDFPKLNYWLDTIQKRWDANLSLNDSMKAALSFAAGVAAHQVYSASVSGTYGVDQAQMAIQRFGFSYSELLIPPSFGLTGRVAEDIKAALPVHLAVVDAAVTVGHNVVADGYNTDSFYHYNFGWGGAYNGWYTLPPTGMPYNLNVIEGVVVNIKNTYAELKPLVNNEADVRFCFVSDNELRIFGIKDHDSYLLSLYNSAGSLVTEQTFNSNGNSEISVSLPRLGSGIYFYTLQSEKRQLNGKIIKP